MTTENELHKRLWKLYEAYAEPGSIMYHIPNGELRGPKVARKLRDMGVIPGVPDFICHSHQLGFRTFYVELKAPGERRSKPQVFFHAKAASLDIDCYTFDDLSLAVAHLQRAKVLRSDVKFMVSDDPATDAERTAGRSEKGGRPADQSSLTPSER